MDLSFEESKARLEEIADLVAESEVSLDEALALYEEAVKIGLHACDVSEQDILAQGDEGAPEEAAIEGDDASESVEAVEAIAVEEEPAGAVPGVMDAHA